MTSNSKTKLEEIRIIVWMALGWIYWLASGHAPQPTPSKRPELHCARCGSKMRVVRIIHDPIPLLALERGLAYLDSS
jgi:hypothetical protein